MLIELCQLFRQWFAGKNDVVSRRMLGLLDSVDPDMHVGGGIALPLIVVLIAVAVALLAILAILANSPAKHEAVNRRIEELKRILKEPLPLKIIRLQQTIKEEAAEVDRDVKDLKARADKCKDRNQGIIPPECLEFWKVIVLKSTGIVDRALYIIQRLAGGGDRRFTGLKDVDLLKGMKTSAADFKEAYEEFMKCMKCTDLK